jgi:hypothetical protein
LEDKMRCRSHATLRLTVAALLVAGVGLLGSQCNRGLNAFAFLELEASGVNKYLGEFQPVASTDVGDGWVRHDYSPDGGNGPICIAGTPYSVFTRAGNPANVLIFEQGGGACWQDFYFCNILASAQAPPFPRVGIWDFDSPDNPFADYSIVYMPYCDGSVFSGDNEVADGGFPFGPVRFHRGLRNQSAGMDLARATVPHPSRVVLAGSSAGGVGVAGFAPFLARFVYGNNVKLMVFNDAGPVAINLDEAAAIAARAADWQFGQFYPASCTECSDTGQPTAAIRWRLQNDSTIREALYSTDGDATDRFFLNVPTQEEYRELLLSEHDPLNAEFPDRYKRFIVSGDSSHTALQSLFFTQTANGVPLNEWTDDFLVPRPFWVDIVEDFVPLP